MKMTTEHTELLSGLVKPLDTPEERRRYLRGDIPRLGAVQDLTKRYRWDLFYRVHSQVWDAFDGAYSDAHLYTALKAIVPPLEPPKTTEIALTEGATA